MKKSGILLTVSICALTGVGLFIRFWGLWEYQLSPDECTVLMTARGDTVFQVWEASLHRLYPPLFFFILHYLMKISENPIFLKSISLIPGAAIIPVFYSIGRKLSGLFSGLTMAYIGTFSYAAVLLSGVIRPYGMLLFFLSAALWFFISYTEDSDGKYLSGYVLCMILAVNVHYAALIPCVAISLFLSADMFIRRKTAREFRKTLVIHSPLLLAIALLYVFHMNPAMNSPTYAQHVKGWLQFFFPESVYEWIIVAYDLYSGLFLPSNYNELYIPLGYADHLLLVISVMMFALTLMGCVALWRSHRRAVMAVIVITFMANLVLTILKKYPFGSFSHSLFLLPMVSLLIGASVQGIIDSAGTRIRSLIEQGKYQWFEPQKGILMKAAFLIYMVSALVIAHAYGESEYLRRYISRSRMEYPLKLKTYNETMNFLQNNIGQNDIVIIDKLTAMYMIYESWPTNRDIFFEIYPPIQNRGLSGAGLLKVIHRGRGLYIQPVREYHLWTRQTPKISRLDADLYAVPEWEDGLWDVFRMVRVKFELSEYPRIWLVSIGWLFVDKDFLLKDPYYRTMIDRSLLIQGKKLVRSGAHVFAFKTDAIVRGLEERTK